VKSGAAVRETSGAGHSAGLVVADGPVVTEALAPSEVDAVAAVVVGELLPAVVDVST
jgi:hypothetical protein